MSAAHRGAVATVAASSDIGDNSSNGNTKEYKCNERGCDTHDDGESVDK
jgi:hypothetical protein